MAELAHGPHDGSAGVAEPVSVRRATRADLAVVVELRLALLREYGDHRVYGRLRDDADDRAHEIYKAQLESDEQVIFLAERTAGPSFHSGRRPGRPDRSEGAAVVGILRCVDSVGSPLLFPRRYCYVSSVYVRPEHRRSGILGALLDRASQWARDRGHTEMRLHNSSDNAEAIASWDAYGFEVVEQLRVRPL